MSIFELKSATELKATNNPLSNQQLTGISDKIVDLQEKNPIFKATMPEFLFRPPFGRPRNIPADFLREISKNPYIFSIIKTLQDEAANSKWDIVVRDGFEVTKGDEVQRQEIKQFFLNPNSDNESFTQILRKLIYDISVLDSGVLVKVFNKVGKLVQIRAIDGSSINKNPDMYGSMANRKDFVPTNIYQTAKSPADYKQLETQFRSQYDSLAAYFQYSTTVMNSTPIPFGKREIVYIMQHPNPAGVYSICSPLQAAIDIALSLIFGSKYHLDFFMNGNTVDGIISLPGAKQVQTDAFKDVLNSTIMTGRDQFGISRKIGHRLPIVGLDNVKFTPLNFNSKDMEIIQQQQWFSKILWMQFGVTAVEMGFSEDSNQATDKNQSKVATKRGIKPLLDNIAYHFNDQILTEFDGGSKFEFKFIEDDIDEEIKKRTLQEQEIRMGLKSWQMIAEEEGLDINRLQKDKEENQESEFGAGFDDFNNPQQKQDGSGPNGQGLGPGKGKADGSGLKDTETKSKPISLDDIVEEITVEIDNIGEELTKDIDTLEVKHKYIKRVGKPGGYVYYYRNNRTGEIFKGQAPKKEIQGPRGRKDNIRKEIDKANAEMSTDDKKIVLDINNKFLNNDTSKNHNTDSNGKYKTSRLKLHNEIMDHKRFNNHKAEGGKNLFIFAGSPASGKTTTLTKHIKGAEVVNLNADDIKEHLDFKGEKFNGYNAALIHEESSDVLKSLVDKHIAKGSNILLDQTMKSGPKAMKLIQRFKDKGYKVHLLASFVEPTEAIKRAKSRFESSKRFVPYNFIGEVGDDIKANAFNARDKVDSYVFVDNNGDISKGGKHFKIGGV